MIITPSILQHEFIGLKAKVVGSSNPSCVGISGQIIDESRNTFTFLHKKLDKVIAKETSIFHFTLTDGQVIQVDGKMLVGRPEDRAKKIVRRHW